MTVATLTWPMQTFRRKSSLELEQSMGLKMWRLKHHLWKIATMTQMCYLVLSFKTHSVLEFQIMFFNRYVLKLSTSALAGDPDPNPRVFDFLIAILRSVLVSATR